MDEKGKIRINSSMVNEKASFQSLKRILKEPCRAVIEAGRNWGMKQLAESDRTSAKDYSAMLRHIELRGQDVLTGFHSQIRVILKETCAPRLNKRELLVGTQLRKSL